MIKYSNAHSQSEIEYNIFAKISRRIEFLALVRIYVQFLLCTLQVAFGIVIICLSGDGSAPHDKTARLESDGLLHVIEIDDWMCIMTSFYAHTKLNDGIPPSPKKPNKNG